MSIFAIDAEISHGDSVMQRLFSDIGAKSLLIVGGLGENLDIVSDASMAMLPLKSVPNLNETQSEFSEEQIGDTIVILESNIAQEIADTMLTVEANDFIDNVWLIFGNVTPTDVLEDYHTKATKVMNKLSVIAQIYFFQEFNGTWIVTQLLGQAMRKPTLYVRPLFVYIPTTFQITLYSLMWIFA